MTNFTQRPVAPGMEEQILRGVILMLDHGFIQVVDYMGDDQSIVDAARVSYGRGTRKPSEDEALIRYLMRHRHTTPFEMCEVKFHVKLPIFVARQWIRHRMANVNEYSARYSILDREFYIPEPENMAAQSQTNRQGRGSTIPAVQAAEVMRLLTVDANTNYDHYLYLLNEYDDGVPINPSRDGLARELARMNLTLNTYTQWYWKTDLHNLFHFLSLRAEAHAQYEIRVYAEEMLRMTHAWVPFAARAFEDYRLGAFTLSAQALNLIRQANVTIGRFDQSGLSRREYDELVAALKNNDR